MQPPSGGGGAALCASMVKAGCAMLTSAAPHSGSLGSNPSTATCQL